MPPEPSGIEPRPTGRTKSTPCTSFRRNPRPDFDASREKLQRLGEGEGNMTKEEFKKVKEELEAEYLVTFKKTVTMQEVFLTQNHQRKLSGRIRERGQRLLRARAAIPRRAPRAPQGSGTAHGKNTNKHKEVADAHVRLPSVLTTLSTAEHGTMEKFLAKTSDIFEKFRNMEGRIASDTLRYYQRDSNAAKALLIRRAHSATPKKWTRKLHKGLGLCWSRIWATSGTRFCLTKLPEKFTIYSTMVGLIKAKNDNFGGEFVNHMVKAFTLRHNSDWKLPEDTAELHPKKHRLRLPPDGQNFS
ncbi:sorting nexin [Culex quinquefasciatus]|uniref:Sorting nexin n=1 Tax=Culex quinquefasciatus TaxID=7176 RepID=B0X0L1_CULQU|nr:sorting nexin [Culex quinquefasciatus]|eukprot:XP_001863183.1 sorting nexin [Culex quinquefasciatus]